MSRIDFKLAEGFAKLFVDGQHMKVTAHINQHALGTLERFIKEKKKKGETILQILGRRGEFINRVVRQAIAAVASPLQKAEYDKTVKSVANPIVRRQLHDKFANEYGAFAARAVPLYMEKVKGIVTLPFDLKKQAAMFWGLLEHHESEAENGVSVPSQDEALQELDGLAAAPGDLGSGSDGPARWSAAPALSTSAHAGAGESETGWDLAFRGSSRAQTLLPQHASTARKRIRAAVAPVFATALDRAVDANLLTQFAAGRPGGVDARKLRTAYAEAATRAFAAEFVRLVGGQPPASAEDIALGAIIAVAIAQTTGRYPIVPPAAVAPMAVLVHRTLRPRLAELARMAAVIAVAAPAASAAPARRQAAPAHEMAW